jgi:hypothetical protein
MKIEKIGTILKILHIRKIKPYAYFAKPNAKARRRGAASVPPLSTIFYLYIILNWLSIKELW